MGEVRLQHVPIGWIETEDRVDLLISDELVEPVFGTQPDNLQQFGNALVLEVRQQLARLYAVIELDLRRADPTGVQPLEPTSRCVKFGQ